MSLTVSDGFWLSLIVSYSFRLSLTVSLVTRRCYMSLTVSSSSMKLLHVSHCRLWLLAASPSAL